MELLDYELEEFVNKEGNIKEFEIGNGHWWQNSFSCKIGYGFGFKENFCHSFNSYSGINEYSFNLIFKL